MSAVLATAQKPIRRALLALAVYLIFVVGLTTFAGFMISNLLDSFEALNAGRETLAHLDGQVRRAALVERSVDPAVNGPPFLEGKTVTVAGAALQERVGAAVKKVGGKVLSSQIELQGPRAAEGFVGVTESLEIDQASLQPMLYDLEAGMPFLFVDSLAVQAPQVFGEAEGASMRVLIAVSGQWRENQ
jgi:general secretion pathway protein M